ncbi:uncharacterized protein CANTADRAFT_10181 [Suhomyces tanzawaensis NRRL Y-17324]|uniref:Uncharacterized protein n=1 Tax=Suhomyces tanzawaensis NRRL Y-17324 TaxID=984487 RepID=A0A1E4SNE7_9ASCO|nr:uncharacterized protein CANTADRAFT_10181 [Suhomyces tanzawaensis NRRL Y-17324]ODV81049.1 hypothetical protein CANTADRAFT_10181 [Suhomyces tanzawaensis NRRL Y-17324]
MSSLLYTFRVRKLSTFKSDGTWHHYPQRTDLSVHFFKLRMDSVITVSAMWKGTTLERVVLEPTVNVVSVIAKYPSIGYKQSDPYGKLLKRFQISFNDQDEYEKCYKCMQESLKLQLVPGELEKKSDEGTWYDSMSQMLSQASQSIEASQIVPDTQVPEPFEQFASQAQAISVQPPLSQLPEAKTIVPSFIPSYMPIYYPPPPQQNIDLAGFFHKSSDQLPKASTIPELDLRSMIIKNLQDEDFRELVFKIDKLIGTDNL